MTTYTTNPIKITDSSFPVATAIFGDLGFVGTQTVSGTKRAQIIPFTLLGLATTTTVLQKASNLSDLADAIAARGNLGAKNLWYVAGTTAPAGTVGIINDFAFNDNGVLYEKTAATTWTSRIDFVTQAELTAANYLTATAANLLYAPIGENAGPGLRYTYNTSTTFPATTGQILLSAATFAATTSISVHTSDRNSRDFASILDLGVAGSRLQLTFDGAEETYAWFNITAIATSGSTRTYTVTHIQSNGTPANGEMLLQVVTVGGGGGGGGGIRLERTFSNTTTGNPTSGTLRLASSNPQTTPATVKINDTRNVNSLLTAQGNLLDKIKIGNIIQITNIASGVYHVYQVTGISTAIVATTTTSYNFTCDWLFGTAGVSSFPNNAEVAFTWLPDNSTASSLTVRTVNSSVTGTPSELVLPNGTLAIASGVATYTPASSSSSGGATGLRYTYNTTAGSGVISAAALATATSLTINTTDATTPTAKDATNVLARFKNGAIIQVAKDESNWVRFNVTADYASGAVTVTVDQSSGAIASGDTVYLSIVSDAPSAGGGGGGITWVETSGATNIANNTGYVCTGSTEVTLTLPTSGAVIGLNFQVAGRGSGGWRVAGAGHTITWHGANDGTRVLGAEKTAASFVCVGANRWLIVNHEGPITLESNTIGSYRYVWLDVTAAVSVSTAVGSVEFQLFSVAGGTNIALNINPTSNKNLLGGSLATLTNGNLTEGFCPAWGQGDLPLRVGVDLGTPQPIVEYGLCGYQNLPSNIGQSFKSWTLRGSNTSQFDASGTILHTVSAQTTYTQGVLTRFSI
ncbi:MAG: hypothetical protein ACRC62_18390 [Microcoleus sp.]